MWLQMNTDEDGVYMYNKNALTWTRLKLGEPYVPREDGLHVVYFRNRKCPGCKAFDRIWIEYIKKHREDHNIKEFIIVQCTHFFYECFDGDAVDTFILYLVLETPQVIAIISENSTPIYIEREIGVDTLDKLEIFVNGTFDRMKRYFEENHEEETDSGSLYIDLDFKKPKEVVSKLRKLLFEGRNIREVCDEKGCRIFIE